MKIGLLLLLTLAAACGSAPDVKRPELDFTLPERFRGGDSPDGPVQGEWWTDFGDPRIEKVVDEVLEHNHDLRAAAARIQGAVAQARIVGADLYPQAGGNVNVTRFQQKFFGLDIPGSDGIITTRATSHGLSLDLSWEIDVWGRIRSARSAAMADLEARQADLLAARLSLIAQTLKVWFAVSEARRQVDLAQATLESRRATSEWARSRYRRGIGAPAVVRLFLSNEASAEARLRLREQQLEGLLRELEVLMGRYPSGEIVTGKDLPSVPMEIPAGLPADLVARRPDLAAAERNLAAADARVAESRAALYPRISLTGSAGTASEELIHLVDGRFFVWNLLTNLTQPVFQGGRLRARVDLAEARSREALAHFLGAALRAYGEVEIALGAIEHLGRQEGSLTISVREAREAERLARQRYVSGIEGPDTLLEAQRAALAAESQLLTVRRQRIESRINLHLALGGGYGPTPGPSKETPEGPSGEENRR